jgi:hypothetical protein
MGRGTCLPLRACFPPHRRRSHPVGPPLRRPAGKTRAAQELHRLSYGLAARLPAFAWGQRRGRQQATSNTSSAIALYTYLICLQRRISVMPRYALETIIVILLLLWLLGWLVVPIGGNLIHLLLVIILVVVLIRVLQGRNPLP